jgi:glycosyltransferase involved in cell wall biosynthesis
LKKLIYVFSNIQNSLGFEWLARYIDKNKYDTLWVFLNPDEGGLQQRLRDWGLRVIVINYKGKADLLPAIFKLVKLFRKEKPDIVHAHLFEASLSAMIASWWCRIRMRVYTRHHAFFHHSDHPGAVKYDKLCNRLATHIVAVSRAVSNVLRKLEDVPESKIYIVHHGFELDQFSKTGISRQRIDRLLGEYNPHHKRPVVGVISRYIKWKGLQFIIPAFKEVLKVYPDALLILANARGTYRDKVEKLLAELPPGSYTEIEFENDIFALYQLFDVFVHAPIREDAEAFGQIYVETMAAGICLVGTLAGIAPDLLRHKENAWVVPFSDQASIEQGILTLLNDKQLSSRIAQNAFASVQQEFTVEAMIKKLDDLYAQ